MVKREFVVAVALLALVAVLAGACSAAQPAAEALLGAQLPCGPPVEADGDHQAGPVPDDPALSQEDLGQLLTGPLSTDFDPAEVVIVSDDANGPLVLGPAWPIEVKKVTPLQNASGGSCQFEIALSTEGLDVFNMIAPLCFQRTERCATGQLAIVADGRLLSAPTIQSASFGEPTFVISSSSTITPDESLLISADLAQSVQFRIVLFDRNSF